MAPQQREPSAHANLCVPKHSVPIWADPHRGTLAPSFAHVPARAHPTLKATVPPHTQDPNPTAPSLSQSKQEARRLSVRDPLSPSLPQEGPEKGDKGTGRPEKGQGGEEAQRRGSQGKTMMGRLAGGGIETQRW